MPSKTATLHRITFPVRGMSCGSCVRRLETALREHTGVTAVDANLMAGEVTISFEPRNTGPAPIAAVIRQRGYEPGPPRPGKRG